MKPGRYPEDHPLEQAARDKLREPSPEAHAKREQQQQQTTQAQSEPVRRPTANRPRRWT